MDAAPPPPAPLRLQPVQSMSDGLQNVVAGLATERDKRFYSEYGPPAPQSEQAMGNMFRSSWIPRRIVSNPADDGTRAWVKLNWDGYDDQKEGGAKAVELAEAHFELRAKFNEARTWGRLYGGAAIIVVMKGDTRFSAEMPLDVETVRKDSLLRLHVVDRYRLYPIGRLDDDMNSPNFGLPTAYRLRDTGTIIHWSRVIRFGGNKLPHDQWVQNQYWDDSVLVAPMDSVKNYETATHGAASMIWEANVDILKMSGLADMLQNHGEEEVADRVRNGLIMKSFNKTLLLDKDTEDYAQKQMSFGGINDLIVNFAMDLCGAAEQPAVRLFGRSPSGLNATGDNEVRNYYDNVAAGQEKEMRPQLSRVYDILIRSTLGKMPKNFAFTFNPLWQISDAEKANIDKVRAETDAIYLRESVLTEGTVARELFDRKTYRTMEKKDVKLAEEMALEPDPVEIMLPKGKPNGQQRPVTT